MTITTRALLAASSLFTLACGTTPHEVPLRTDSGVTPNPLHLDAGTKDVPDASQVSPLDAGDDAGGTACPPGYLDTDGGCAGPCGFVLSAVPIFASGDEVYAGGGPQPILVARLSDPRALIPAEAQARLTVSRSDGSLPLFEGLGESALDETAGVSRGFRRVLDTRQMPEDSYLAQAFLDFDGGTLASNVLTLIVDRTGPTLEFTLPGLALDGGPVLRDVIAKAQLAASDEGSGIGSLTLQGAGPRVDPVSGSVNRTALLAAWPVQLVSGDKDTLAAQADVHFADVPFDTGGDQAGEMVLLATATDRAGNVTQAELSFAVSRLKWNSAQVTGSADGLVLGETGRIYGALIDVWGLDPSGTTAWHASTGAGTIPKGAPLVRARGEEQVDFSVIDYRQGRPTSTVEELCGDGTKFCVQASFDPVVGAMYEASPAFSASARELIVADNRFCGFYSLDELGGPPLGHAWTGAGDGTVHCPVVEIALTDGAMLAAGLNGNAVYTWSDAGFGFASTVGSGSWTTAGVAVSGSAAWFAAGDQLIGVDLSSSPPDAIGTFTAGGAVAAPVIDGQGNIFVASDEGVLSKLDPTGSLLWSSTLGGAGSAPGSPAVGADGTVYIVDGSEALDAIDSQGHLLWTTGSGYAAAIRSPTIDPCNHTLYVSAADLESVKAVVVDSAGLDVSGHAWPVYRHDYFGTGDALSTNTIDCGDHL